MSKWTHNICRFCWFIRNPAKEPGRLYNDIAVCCFCGDENTDGIYIRMDPKKLTCHHKED